MAAQRLVIVVWSAGPERPVLAAAPFVYALTARALDLDVEMHFTSTAVRWLVPGVADLAATDAARSKTVGDFLREAHAAGARLLACSMALAEHAPGETLVPECAGRAGAASVVAATIADGTRTLVF
jgi:predicted peroxiredoxin